MCHLVLGCLHLHFHLNTVGNQQGLLQLLNKAVASTRINVGTEKKSSLPEISTLRLSFQDVPIVQNPVICVILIKLHVLYGQSFQPLYNFKSHTEVKCRRWIRHEPDEMLVLVVIRRWVLLHDWFFGSTSEDFKRNKYECDYTGFDY